MPVRRIAEIEEVSPRTVYDKIDFIHRQCLAFARERESKFPVMPIQKRRLIHESKKAIAKVMEENPDQSRREAVFLLLQQGIQRAKLIGKWKDRWVFHPLANMHEPEKAMCHLTDFGDLEPDHAAWLYNRASLHGADSHFNRVRRRYASEDYLRNLRTSLQLCENPRNT